MKLDEFIRTFVRPNTLIMLCREDLGSICEIKGEGKNRCMAWELLQDKVWQSKYSKCKVIGLTDTVEGYGLLSTVNIVIDMYS